jgi:hypothetical protein
MRIIKVIEFWVLVNTRTGELASLYGAPPWRTEGERAEWALALAGFTWQRANGSVGLDRAPAETREQAEGIMAEFNEKLAA